MIKEATHKKKSSHQANPINHGSDNMKQDWEIKKLGEVCDFQGGSQPPKSQFIYEPKDGYVRFLQIRDFASDKNITYIPESKKNRYCKEGDILLGRYGASVGKVLVNKAGAYNVAVMKTIPNEAILYKRYLFFYLNTDDFQTRLLNTASRSAQDGFSKDDIFDFPILIPPLPEQQRIVSILDECFAAIDKAKTNAEQNLKNAKELFESYLQGVFERKSLNPDSNDFLDAHDSKIQKKSNNQANQNNQGSDNLQGVFENGNWETKTLKELTLKIGSGATPRGGQENYKSEGISLVRSMNVHDWEFRERNLAFIDEKQAKELDGVTLQEYDVLLNITGASVARCCVMPKEYLPARVNQHVSIIRPKKEILDARFLNLLLTSKPYKDQLLFTGEQGATRQAITKAQIETFRIAIPSLKEQQIIVRQLDALRAETQKLEALYQKKIADLEELKKSILQKAFAGELKTEKSRRDDNIIESKINKPQPNPEGVI